MPSDPNWLFSSTAQSAAAVFAIVGGFITTRILALNTERRALIAEIQARHLRLSHLEARRDQLRRDLQWQVLYRAFDKTRMELLDADPSIEGVLADTSGYSIPEEKVREEYDRLKTARDAARAFVDQHSDSIDPEEEDVGRWLRKVGADMGSLEWEFVSHFYDVKRESLRPRDWIGTIRLPTAVSPFRPPPDPVEDLEDQLHRVEGEIALLAREHQGLIDRLPSLVMPKSAWWALAILVFIGCTSVILPLALLPSDNAQGWLRLLTVGLFGFGLLALVIYIAVEFHSMRSPPKA